MDRLWSWWPAGNDELVIGECVCRGWGRGRGGGGGVDCADVAQGGRMCWSGCRRGIRRRLCIRSTIHGMCGWWAGDELGPFKRLISYVWGKLRIGPKERRIPKSPCRGRTRRKGIRCWGDRLPLRLIFRRYAGAAFTATDRRYRACSLIRRSRRVAPIELLAKAAGAAAAGERAPETLAELRLPTSGARCTP